MQSKQKNVQTQLVQPGQAMGCMLLLSTRKIVEK